MSKIKIGKTGLTVERNAFGALPIQRVDMNEAVYLLQKAQDGGMEYFDTALVYSDSEEKMGEAFKDGRREKIIIATKTPSDNVEGFWQDLETSLKSLRTDYIDVYQFHNPEFCPLPGGEDGLYDAMIEARRQGKIRFIGITEHRLKIAREAIACGAYDTLQFPFSYIGGEQERALVKGCEDAGIGFICMKALAGGLISNSAAACAYISQYENALPIWGIQREKELDEFLSYIDNPPELTDELQAVINADRKQLSGDFCRGCGYCQPCPAGIQIEDSARITLFMRRMPLAPQLTPESQEMMKKIEDCLHCGACASRCPYGLDTPALLEKNYEDYKNVLSGKTVITQ